MPTHSSTHSNVAQHREHAAGSNVFGYPEPQVFGITAESCYTKQTKKKTNSLCCQRSARTVCWSYYVTKPNHTAGQQPTGLLLNAVLDIFSSSVIPKQGAMNHMYKNHCMVFSVQKQGFPNYSKDTFQDEEKNVKGGLFPLSAELTICQSIIIKHCNQKLRHEL